MLANPFTPGFGQVPYRLAGREKIVSEITHTFDLEYRDPSLTGLFIGARGTGKTALLTHLGAMAKQHGWLSVDTSVRAGMLQDILLRTIEASSGVVESPSSRHLTGIEIGNFLGLEWEQAPRLTQNWRGEMSAVLDKLAEKGIGLLVTVDEIDPSLSEVAELISTYQIFIREERKVALLLAGLPGKILSLMDKKDITFIRRAKRYRLGTIPKSEVMSAFVETVEANGRTIKGPALNAAADAIDGFAYMMQAVGYRAWEACQTDEITAGDVRKGILVAQKELEDSILESTYRDLASGDRVFMEAMLEDEGESAIADVIARTGKGNNSIQKTRRRLIDLGVIGERGRGYIGFELPFFKEYLRTRSS